MFLNRLASKQKNLLPLLIIVIVPALTTIQLRQQGRRWWCACGQFYLWAGDVWSPHNSQHFLDPYSFTHLLHGFIFCALLALLIPRVALNRRLCLAVFVESLWEILENSTYVIQRYRAETIAIGYQGDTIFNSLGDILSCAVGFALAWRLGFRRSLVVFFITEIVLLVWVRDSLLLNVVMLIYPIEAIKTWQMMGH